MEFLGYLSGQDKFLLIPESKTFQIAKLVPGAVAGSASLRWMDLRGEQRLVIGVGSSRTPFDDAPENLRKALSKWVDKFAALCRKGRYES